MKKQALFLAFICCCISKPERKELLQVNRNEFHPPVLVHLTYPNHIQNLIPDYLPEIFSVLVGKFKWCDTLSISEDLFRKVTLTADDYFDEYAESRNASMLETDGLQLIPDYKSAITYTRGYVYPGGEPSTIIYYPLYLVNETAHTKYYKYDSSNSLPIQEAVDNLDQEGMNWRPIESQQRISCTSTVGTIRIKPGEFLLFLVPKYNGNTATSFRVRIRNGANIVVSSAFLGYLCPAQFNIKKGSWQERYLKSGDRRALDRLFYGAVPKGYDSPD